MRAALIAILLTFTGCTLYAPVREYKVSLFD